MERFGWSAYDEKLRKGNNKSKKIRVFFDYDGTLAKWNDIPFEECFKPGYYRNLKTMDNMVKAAEILSKLPDVEVCSLTAYLRESTAWEDKWNWTDEHLPFIGARNRYFVPYGTSKSEFIKEHSGLKDNDILVDDYSNNLRDWHGLAIKCRNGINGTKGTWTGASIWSESEPYYIAATILGVAYYNESTRKGA